MVRETGIERLYLVHLPPITDQEKNEIYDQVKKRFAGNVFFPEDKVACMGDVYLTGSFPSVDINRGGNVKDLLKVYDRLLTMFPEDVILIPGHGEFSTLEEFTHYIGQVKLMVRAIRDDMRDGATLVDLLGGDVMNLIRWISVSPATCLSNSGNPEPSCL